MSNSRSKKGKSSQVPLFISKLLEMIENPEIEPVISWTSTGDSFNIKNISKFTDEILPQYFKHRNFSSFIRQLNMYGFRKTRHPDGQNIYMHHHFRSGCKNQLKYINRKIREQKEESIVVYQPDRSNNKEIQELKSKQKNLEQACRHFFIQNQKLMEENQNLIKKMENDAKQREKRLQDLLVALVNKANLPQLTEQLSITQGSTQNQFPLQMHATNLLKSFNESSPTKNTFLTNHHDHHMGEMKEDLGIENEDNSFLSINDFINADDYENEINLEQSR